MKAAVFGPNGLELRELAKPQPKAAQLLVRVRYASLDHPRVSAFRCPPA